MVTELWLYMKGEVRTSELVEGGTTVVEHIFMIRLIFLLSLPIPQINIIWSESYNFIVIVEHSLGTNFLCSAWVTGSIFSPKLSWLPTNSWHCGQIIHRRPTYMLSPPKYHDFPCLLGQYVCSYDKSILYDKYDFNNKYIIQKQVQYASTILKYFNAQLN